MLWSGEEKKAFEALRSHWLEHLGDHDKFKVDDTLKRLASLYTCIFQAKLLRAFKDSSAGMAGKKKTIEAELDRVRRFSEQFRTNIKASAFQCVVEEAEKHLMQSD